MALDTVFLNKCLPGSLTGQRGVAVASCRKYR